MVLDGPRQGPRGGRRVVAYLGGLDLTDGRYDVPEHPLFSSLSAAHEKDFYNPCEPSISGRFGPR